MRSISFHRRFSADAPNDPILPWHSNLIPITHPTQSHFHLNDPSLYEVERTIKDFSALGLKVMITELDVDVLPARGNMGNADIGRREQGDASLNPYTAGLPDDVQAKLAKRYADLFGIYLRHRKAVIRMLPRSISESECWAPDWRNRQAMAYLAAYDERFQLRADEGARSSAPRT